MSVSAEGITFEIGFEYLLFCVETFQKFLLSEMSGLI